MSPPAEVHCHPLKRAALVLLIGGGLAVLAFLATRPSEPSVRAPAPEARDDLEALRASASLPGAPVHVPTERESVAVVPEDVAPGTDAEVWRVCVVDGAGGAPVAGATVSVLDLERIGRELSLQGIGFDSIAGLRLRAARALRETTGPDGCASFPSTASQLMVEARSGALWAFAVVAPPPPEEGLTLRLSADRSLSVRVIDTAGNPVGGVPVALRRGDPSRAGYSWKWTDTAADSGIATFLHFQRRLEQGPGWHVTFAFPVLGDPLVPVDETTPPEPPVLFTLPETGSLRVRAWPVGGSPFALEGAELRVDAFEGSPRGERLLAEGPWSRPALDARGEALVPWIGVGLRVEVSLTRIGVELASASLPGPSRAGEEVVAQLEWRTRCVTGRFVLRDGRAWPAGTVQCQLVIFPSPALFPRPRELTVDDGGRFRLEVDRERPVNGTRSLRITARHPDGPGDVLALVPLDAEIPPEGLDLGDVLLDHGEPLVSGRVVDTANRPVAGATFRLRILAKVPDGELWPAVRTSGTAHTGVDGEFALHLPLGEAVPGDDLRLTTLAGGFADDRDRDVRRGASDVEVVLAAAGGLAGSLELDEGLGFDDVFLILDGPAREPVQLRSDATFERQALVPDVYTLEVWRLGPDRRPESRPAALVEGLVVRAGETCRDPRVQDLFVENPLPTLRIRVVDRASRPLVHAVASVRGVDELRPATSGSDGVCRVRVEELPVDLHVAAFGYAPEELFGVDSDREVVLEAGIPVRLRVRVVPPAGDLVYRLGADLQVVDADGLVRGSPWGGERVGGETFLDESGELALGIPAAGVYRCGFFVSIVHEHVGRGATVELADPPRITVVQSSDEQLFELSIPRSAVEDAVHSAAQSR